MAVAPFLFVQCDCQPPLARDYLLSYISVMTEITKNADRLPPAVERFVLKWGDMGSAWGVNRSVSQIHALLYLAGRPLTAEDIADSLGIARSNVSNSLKELMGWGLIRRVPMRGDRRDHFEAEGDIWELVTRIAIGRKAREIDPVVETLRACLSDAQSDPRVDALAKKRLSEMFEFTSAADRWFQQMLSLPRGKLKTLMKLGAKVAKILPSAKR
jgi:DNA-binding transcriptional regulator GbsR (MarR family)